MPESLIDKHLLSLFLEEAKERTVSIETGLLKLEKAENPAEFDQSLLVIMRVTHSLKGASGFVGMRAIEKACHWMEDILTALKAGKMDFTKAVVEQLLMVNDAINKSATISVAEAVDETPVTEALEAVKNRRAKPAQKPSPQKPAVQEQPAQPVQMLNVDENAENPFSADPANESIRITLNKLDALLYRSEELLRSKERLLKRRQEAADLYDLALEFESDSSKRAHDLLLSRVMGLVDGLDEDYRTLETATFFLESEVRRARTQSFHDACIGLTRVVRDACEKAGKKAELVINGDTVEIDQSVVQRMNDILRHLVRNAVDHGIETPEERQASGKSPVGTVTIVAHTSGDRLRVEVQDDGQGIPLLRNLNRTRETRGGAAFELEGRLLIQELFRPGYSTASSVTKLSGRGVGLDAVKRTVERLRGYLEVSLNELGGTTFTIVLPLSLTITRGLMLDVGEQRLGIETATARRLIKAKSSSIHRDGQKVFVDNLERKIPAVFIKEWLFDDYREELGGNDYDVVMIGEDDKETAVIVDHITGEEELLVRPLGPRASGNRKYNGAATLASGEMILILNPVALQEGALGVETKGKAQLHTVLIVDDSPTVRNAHKRTLEEHGFAVEVSVNGSDAWERLQTMKPDIIVADVDMPIMDGLTLAETIRGDEKHKDIPIILVTSRVEKIDKDRSKKAKVAAHILKNSPEHEHLADIVGEFIAKKPA